MIAERRHFLAVALVTMSMLLFETLLTRLFSVTIWYHFGVLARAPEVSSPASPGHVTSGIA